MRSPLFELSSRHRGERSRSTLGDGTKMQVRLLAGEELIILLRLFPSLFSTTSLLSRLLLMFFPTGLVRCFGTTRRQPQTPPTRLPRAASRPRSDPAIQTSSPLARSRSQRGRPISRSARWGAGTCGNADDRVAWGRSHGNVVLGMERHGCEDGGIEDGGGAEG